MWKRLAEQDDNSRQSNNDEIQKFMDILSSKRHQEVDQIHYTVFMFITIFLTHFSR